MHRSVGRTLLCAVAAAALVAAPLVSVSAASADTAGTGLVIEEAYLKGGSANQPFTNKFVELGNPTDSAVSVDGWSVQYRAATGTGAPAVGKLNGSVPRTAPTSCRWGRTARTARRSRSPTRSPA
ncbi:hypothetical protein P9139_01480 [Curtobacterium flaccumfaciens]|nr:hypothetical protein P9139_01480 [Curtobacterium flaccumfaciens]